MKVLKRLAVSLCLAISGLMSLGVSAEEGAIELKRLVIGSNPSGSTYYMLASSISKLYQERFGIRASAQPFAGSSLYLPMIHSGEMPLGISNAVDAAFAFQGQGAIPFKLDKLRSIARVWVIPYAFVTTGDSGIKTIEDLKGKRVMGELPTNAALTEINKAILATGGLTEKDVRFARVGGLIEGIDAVIRGRAAAAPVSTTMAALVESHTTTPGGLRIIANGAQASDEFFKNRVPGVSVLTVEPSERYPYIIGPTPVTGYDTLLVSSTDVSDDDAYQLAKVIYESWDQLKRDVPALKDITKEMLVSDEGALPLHDGARRFYQEVGLAN